MNTRTAEDISGRAVFLQANEENAEPRSGGDRHPNWRPRPVSGSGAGLYKRQNID